jgi:hypothetical protein
MSNEINYLGSSGLTLTYDVVNGNTVTLSAQTLTERGTTGHYYGSISGLSAGDYAVFIKNGSTILGAGTLHWDGSKERIDNLDAAVSTRSTQTSVNSIPTNPLLTSDSRLNNLDATISTRATQTSVNAIPTTPLLTGDSRLNNLDAAISTRATQSSVNAIPTNPLLATQLSDIANAVWTAVTRSLTDKANFTLTSGERTAIATAVESALINDGDGQALMATVAAAVRTNLATELARIDAAISTRATQSSVNAIPTNPLLATQLSDISNAVWTAVTRSLTDKANFTLTSGERTAIATAVESALINDGDGQALIDAIVDLINTNLDLPLLELQAIATAVRSELATELGRIDIAVSSRLSSAGYTAPDNAGIGSLNTKLTTGRANNLDNLNDTITSRLATSGYTAPDNAGISSLNGKLTTGRANNLDNLDTTVSSRSTFDHISELVDIANDTVLAIAEAVETRLLNEADGGAFLAAVADAISNLTFDASNLPVSAIVDAVWNKLDTDFSITNSIGKRIKDNLNTTISSRMASASYTAPDNAGIASANTKLDNLKDFDPDTDTVIVRDFTTGAIDADAVGASAITEIQAGLAKTSELDALNNLSASDIQAELTSFGTAKESSVLARPTNPLLTNDSRLNNLDAAVSSRSTFNQATQTVDANIVSVQDATVTDIDDFKTTALDVDLNDFADAVAVQLEDPQGLLKKASDNAAIAALNTQK